MYGIKIKYSWGDEEDPYGNYETKDKAYEKACEMAGREAFMYNEEMDEERTAEVYFDGYKKTIELHYNHDNTTCWYTIADLDNPPKKIINVDMACHCLLFETQTVMREKSSGRTFIGPKENYDNRGHYNNADNSAHFVSDEGGDAADTIFEFLANGEIPEHEGHIEFPQWELCLLPGYNAAKRLWEVLTGETPVRHENHETFMLVEVVDDRPAGIEGIKFPSYTAAHDAMKEAYEEILAKGHADENELFEWEAYIQDGYGGLNYGWRIVEC